MESVPSLSSLQTAASTRVLLSNRRILMEDMKEDGKPHTKTQRCGNTTGDSGDRTQRRRTGHGDAQFAEVDIGTIAGAPPETITITDQDLAGVVECEHAMRADDPPGLGAAETNATQDIMPIAAQVGAKLDSALARQLRARKALDAPMAQKKTFDAMAETCAASDGVELARKKGGPKTSLSTNMEMLLHNLTLTLSTMWSEAVKVVEKIEEEVCGTMRNAETAVTQKDPMNKGLP